MNNKEILEERAKAEFNHVKSAFAEEQPYGERKECYEKDEYAINYRDKGIITHVTQGKDSVSMQFHGWEVVLLNNGTSFENSGLNIENHFKNWIYNVSCIVLFP